MEDFELASREIEYQTFMLTHWDDLQDLGGEDD